jgi:hypothetical protein
MKLRFCLSAALVILLVTDIFTSKFAQAAVMVDRPPQYVAMAFDGSLNLNFWQESLDFAKAADVKFTYFASGVYFTLNQNKGFYQLPHHPAGYSCIGFGGGSADALKQRVDYVNRAYGEGHEIGSHVNGHCPGAHLWSPADWEFEFKQFYDIFFNVFGFNKIGAPGNTFHFSPSEIIGFRAPFLEFNQNMYGALQKHGFRYDTSETASPTLWPKKVAGDQWSFPLGRVTIAGTGKKTISMDYNFFFAQSGAKEDPGNSALYEKQMYDTYMKYFQDNYLGNRAPVNIGHHFAKWNGGAYWRAMRHFASTVCSMPEVKCVTYRELADFMDHADQAHLVPLYQAGQFAKLTADVATQTKFQNIPRSLDVDVHLMIDKADPRNIVAHISGPDAEKIMAEGEMKWFVNDVPSEQLNLPEGSVANVSLKTYLNGHEVITATHTVEMGSSGSIKALSLFPLEMRGLVGDMAEAHKGEGGAGGE